MEEVAKCSCSGCGVHLEFAVELAGTTIVCPNCQVETLLSLPQPENGSSIAAESPSGRSIETILAAFQGKVKWHGTSFFYQAGLLLVTAMIVMLPVIYLLMIAGSAYGVYWWARNFSFLLGGRYYSVYLFTAKLLLYGAPLFAGSIMVFFMLKPFLARAPAGVQ